MFLEATATTTPLRNYRNSSQLKTHINLLKLHHEKNPTETQKERFTYAIRIRKGRRLVGSRSRSVHEVAEHKADVVQWIPQLSEQQQKPTVRMNFTL